MLLDNGGAVAETLASLFNANGKNSSVGDDHTVGNGIRRVVLFQASAKSPERDAEALARELAILAEHLLLSLIHI